MEESLLNLHQPCCCNSQQNKEFGLGLGAEIRAAARRHVLAQRCKVAQALSLRQTLLSSQHWTENHFCKEYHNPPTLIKECSWGNILINFSSLRNISVGGKWQQVPLGRPQQRDGWKLIPGAQLITESLLCNVTQHYMNVQHVPWVSAQESHLL